MPGRRLLALGIGAFSASALMLTASVVNLTAAAGGVSPAPVGVPVGDYQASVTVASTSTTTPVWGEIVQLLGGTGTPQRVANFHVTSAGSVVTAEVRTTSPSDVLQVVTYGAATISPITLTPASWGTVVRGTSFTTTSNPNVVWHGVNSYIGMTIPDDVAALYNNTKANIVRVPVTECEWLPYFQAYSASYRTQIINTVNAATASGHTAILDLHYSCYDDPTTPAYPAYATMTGPDMHSVDFWVDAANQFRLNPNVMFELFNEPKMGASDSEPGGKTGAQVWRDGGTLTSGGHTWSSPGMQKLYDTVRATGATQPVLVDGTAWASNLLSAERMPIDGTNVAYAFHAYAPSGTNPAVYPASLDWAVWPVINPAGAYREAGIMTEFGTNAQDTSTSATGSDYLSSCIAWFSSHHVSWTVYGWYPSNIDSYALLKWYPLWPTSRAMPVFNSL